MRLIDMTRTLRHRGPFSATQPVPMIWTSVAHSDTTAQHGHDPNFSITSLGLLMSDHAGTHVDAWSHMSPKRSDDSIDTFALDSFTARTLAMDVSGYQADELIPVEKFLTALDHAPDGVEGIVFRTGIIPEPCPPGDLYLRGFPGIGAEVVEALADRGIRLIGSDARSPDTAASEHDGPNSIPAHRACLRRGVVIYENLFIPEELCGQVFEFWGMPIKIQGGTGAPVRAVAVLR